MKSCRDKNQDAYRSGEEGEKSAPSDPGRELRLRSREERTNDEMKNKRKTRT